MTRTLRSLLALAAVAALAACAEGKGTGTDDGDTTPIEVGTDADGGGGLDALDVDVADEPDVAGEPDVEPDLPVGGPIGSACDDDDDCETFLCVGLTGGGGVCTSPCSTNASCPRDFDCVLISPPGDDPLRVCLDQDLCIDADGDLHGIGPGCIAPDCDDTLAAINLSADEVCDGVDNDCDGITDEDPLDEGLRCDTGFTGECAQGTTVCLSGLIECIGDRAASVEVCDSRDNDCDGAVDEGDDGAALRRDCYDGDVALIGTGPCAYGHQLCAAGGYSACVGQILPGAEVCDDADNDCDGDADEGLRVSSFFADVDGDTFGDPASSVAACGRPDGYVENSADCDDSRNDVRPGAGERPGDGVDQNCDGTEFCFEDADVDGYRSGSAAALISLDPDCDDFGEADLSTPTGDCDDDHDDTYPGAPERCDGRDNDCDTRVDEAIGCIVNGQPCVDDIDCASGLCQDRVCERRLTCVEDGTCPNRVVGSSGAARVSSPRFVLDVTSPVGPVSPVLESTRYRLTVGAAPYLSDP